MVKLTDCICFYNTHRPFMQDTRTDITRNPKCPVHFSQKEIAMNITSDTSNEITTKRRTILIDDGPVLSEDDSYFPGTFFRVDKITIKTTSLNDDVAIRVSGKRCAPVVEGREMDFRHELSRRDAERAGNDMSWLDQFIK